MSVQTAKKAARKAASRTRTQAAKSVGDEGAYLFADNFLRHISAGEGDVVSGYLPIGSELDVRRALGKSVSQGAEICMPVVVKEAEPLIFRRWREGDALIEESFGTRAPAPSSPECVPTILVVPMLAFDRQGYRLGYGGGFYDRTLMALRAAGPVIAVGAAYADQEVSSVPHDDLDQPLDFIVTERAAIKINR